MHQHLGKHLARCLYSWAPHRACLQPGSAFRNSFLVRAQHSVSLGSGPGPCASHLMPGSQAFLARGGVLPRHTCPSTHLPARGFAARPTATKKKSAPISNGAEALSDPSAEQAAAAAKAAGLENAMRILNKKYGEKTVTTLADNSVSTTEFLSTGALTLDLALGGGLPKGGVVEIYGPESTGKTSLALSAVAQAQKNGAMCAFIDLEHAMSQEFAQKLGVRLDLLTFSQPSSGDEALDIVAQLAGSGGIDIVVVDSVAALIPRNELEGDIGMPTMGAQARLMSSGLRIISPLASKHNCCVIFINQIRMKVGQLFGSPETTSGGQALKYYASQRIDLRKAEGIPANSKQEQLGISVRATVKKNKVAPPLKVCKYDFMFASGINSAGCLLDVAETLQLAVRKGSWYYINDQQVGQGRENTLQYLQQHPDEAEALEQKVWQTLKESKQSALKVEEMMSDSEDELAIDEESMQQSLTAAY